MTVENKTPQTPEVQDPNAELKAALDRYQFAQQNGSREEIEAAEAHMRNLYAPRETDPSDRVEVLPRREAPAQKQFTGAPRRINVTGGRVLAHGGAHKHQPYYR